MDLLTPLYTAFQQYTERVHSLLPEKTGETILFDYDYLVETVAMPALHVALALYALHFSFVIPLLNRISPPKVQVTTVSGSEQTLSRDRMAFQATNLGVNLVLTAVGFYFELDAQRLANSDAVHRLAGFNDMGVLPAWQIGVQLWSFPIGLLMIQEDPVMLIHHIALVWTAVLPTCFRVGFRWHTPFFFGIFELSSLPLGVMNLFKSHPSWARDYPVLYQRVRIIFAVAFLLVRIVWCVPRMLLYLADMGVYLAGLPLFSLVQGYCAVNFLGATLLLGMQFLWGSKVLAALARLFLGGSKKSPKTE